MYYSNGSSTEGLNQIILHIPRRNNNNTTTTLIGKRSKVSNNSSQSPSPPFHFLIRNHCKDIILTGANAEEYYHVELVCDKENNTEYGIQAYGEEAKELYNEINGLSVPAASTTSSNHAYKEKLVQSDDSKHHEQEEEQGALKIIKEAINCMANCYFDEGRILIFKKLRNI
jgi:hypothetical protein